MTLARKAGYVVPDAAYNKALGYLQNQVAATDNADYESKAILLHVLAVAGKGDFALANRLYRDRNALSSSAPGPPGPELRGHGPQGHRPKRSWASWRSGTSTTRPAPRRGRWCAALEPFAGRAAGPLCPGDPRGLAASRPKAKELVDWLMAHRTGNRWAPEKATGPAALALCRWFADSRFTGRALQADRLRQRRAGQGAGHRSGRRQPVDRRAAAVPRQAGREGQAAGQLPDRRPRALHLPVHPRRFRAGRQAQEHDRQLAGRCATTSRPRWNSTAARSPAVSACWKAATRRSAIRSISFPSAAAAWSTSISRRNVAWGTPEERLEYLVVTEPIPSGTTVIEKSVTGPFEHFEIGAGEITFYIGNRPGPGHDPLRALRLRAGQVPRRPHDRPQRPPARAACW